MGCKGLKGFKVIFRSLFSVLFPPEHTDDVHSVHCWVVYFGAVAIAAVVGVELTVAQFSAWGVVVDVGFGYWHAAPSRQQVAPAGFGAAR